MLALSSIAKWVLIKTFIIIICLLCPVGADTKFSMLHLLHKGHDSLPCACWLSLKQTQQWPCHVCTVSPVHPSPGLEVHRWWGACKHKEHHRSTSPSVLCLHRSFALHFFTLQTQPYRMVSEWYAARLCFLPCHSILTWCHTALSSQSHELLISWHHCWMLNRPSVWRPFLHLAIVLSSPLLSSWRHWKSSLATLLDSTTRHLLKHSLLQSRMRTSMNSVLQHWPWRKWVGCSWMCGRSWKVEN